ncbi:hypothetical protein [Natronobiforma cellulositropha]|uniref:hypothetical protein n=1 Tax=Natronobiforma cellulositropha TaxID=1679076 RepID=UPI0021D5F95E|nr:hypothetical protein [Natronobiforma cellulositropha]
MTPCFGADEQQHGQSRRITGGRECRATSGRALACPSGSRWSALERFQGPDGVHSSGGTLPVHQDAKQKYLTGAGGAHEERQPATPSVTLEEVKAEYGLDDHQLATMYEDHFGQELTAESEYTVSDSVEAVALNLTKAAIADVVPGMTFAYAAHAGYEAWADGTNSSAKERIEQLIASAIDHARTGEGESEGLS